MRGSSGQQAIFWSFTQETWPARTVLSLSRKDLPKNSGINTLELRARAGGQILGYEQAGIQHTALEEIDHHAVATLRSNRPE